MNHWLTAIGCIAFIAFAAVVGLGLLALYGGALGYAAWRISGGRRTWAILPVLPLVFATIHFCWGGGVLVNLLSFGRWPRRFGTLASGRPPS